MIEPIRFVLNEQPVSVTVDGERMLLWVLRTDLGLTGVKYGCGEALCGACTVLVDGEPAFACQTPVRAVAGKKVTTIEGLARDGHLHPVQSAFLKQDALQCGFCTPGMVLKASHLLAANPQPTRAQIIAAMDGHLCRCGAHVRIVQAIEEAAGQMKGGGS
jgi:aerobic-type carbon monoxide dehydrogenase small subunit (CoxS/CutS family)